MGNENMNCQWLLGLGLSFVLANGAQASLLQHLDASEPGSVTGNPVIEWSDLSGNAHHASNADGSVYFPSSSLSASGAAGLDFGTNHNSLALFSAAESDAWLDQSAGTGGFCVMVAFKCDSYHANWNDLIGNSSAIASGFGMRYDSGGGYQVYLDGNLGVGGSVSPGDTVVIAFNYDAATQEWLFWDSKGGALQSGSKAAADFSTGSSFTLGATTSGTRYFQGMVGEVRVYDHALSLGEFVTARQAMQEKWIGIDPGWRVIPEDPDFPTEDAIVAYCSVADSAYNLPEDPANEDCTAAFQAALDAASAIGGGTVFVPAGQYRFDGTLTIAENVTLRGRWRELTDSQPAAGTILKIFSGHGNADPNLLDPFIKIGGGGGVKDLTFWHPLQDPANIVPYPYVLRPSKGTLQNITFVNAYQGVRMDQASMCFVDNVEGTILHYGFYADQSAAISRFENLNFGPEFWQWAELEETPVDSAYQSEMLASAVGIDIRDMDGFFLSDCQVRGMKTGLLFAKSPINNAGPSGGYICGLDLRDCVVGFERQDGSGAMVNSYFHGTDKGVLSNSGLTFNTCTLKGDNASYEGPGIVAANCTFDDVLNLTDGKVQLVNCNFDNSGTDLVLGSAVDDIIIAGCRFADGPNITDYSPASNIKIIDHNPVDGYQPPPQLPAKDISIPRKPYSETLFDISDYGAVADDGADDTTAFAAAVADANANGGGIVFVPNGLFEVAGSYTFAPGVELRGTSGSIFGSNLRYGKSGSVLMITGNEGNPEGPAFLNLTTDCGVRGLTLHYNEQDKDMLLPETILEYPYTIRGTGDNIYVVETMMSNPYQGIHFYRADHHLIENCKLGGLKSTVLVEECSDGRIGKFHLKSDFWRDAGIGDYPVGASKDWIDVYVGKYLIGIELRNSTNEVVHSIFNHTAHEFINIDNTSAFCFMTGGEVLQGGIHLGGAQDVQLVMPGVTLNMEGDRTGMWAFRADDTFTGTARIWNGYFAGTPGHIFHVESGTIDAQQMVAPGWSIRGNSNVEVGSGAALMMRMMDPNRFVGTILEAGSTCSILDSFIGEVPDALLSHPGASLVRTIYDQAYISTAANSGQIVNDGMILDPVNLTLVDSPIHDPDVTSDHKNITGARTSDGNYTIDVVDPDFANGQSPRVDIQTYFKVVAPCTIQVYYDSSSGRKLGKSGTYSVVDYVSLNFSVSDAEFDGTDDIEIVITGDSPLLNSINVLRFIDAELPLSAPIVVFDMAASDLMVTEGYTSLSLQAQAQDFDGTISSVALYLDGSSVRVESGAPYTWDETRDPQLLGLSAGDHALKVVATDNDGVTGEAVTTLTVLPVPPPVPVPARIEAEDYDAGEAGVAFYDTTAGNSFGEYRDDDVDIETCLDVGGGYHIGAIASGEWLEYSVDVPVAGEYSMEFRYAAVGGGNLFVKVDGVNRAGSVSLPSTGGWQNWASVNATADLPAGEQKLRIEIGAFAGFNLNWFEISPTAATRYGIWADAYGGAGVIGSETNDYDGDGLANLGEYALDGNPTNALDGGEMPSLSYGSGSLLYIHPQRSDDPDLVYTVETVTNLISAVWTNAGVVATGTNVTGETLNTVTNEVFMTEQNLFIRLKIDR